MTHGCFPPPFSSSSSSSHGSAEVLKKQKNQAHAKATYQLVTREMSSISKLDWKEYIPHVFDLTGKSRWVPVGVVDKENGIFKYAKMGDIKKLGVTDNELNTFLKAKGKEAQAHAIGHLIQQKKMVAHLEEAIISRDQKAISKAISILLWGGMDPNEVWQQIASRFQPNSEEHRLAILEYRACITKEKMKEYGIYGISIEQLVNICSVAEECLANRNGPAEVIKKGESKLSRSLLIDYEKKSFSILGVGPMNQKGGFGKVRSAIEVSLKQVAKDHSEEAVATHVVRKTNLSGCKITKQELEDTRLFGGVHTIAFYRGKDNVQKTSIIMDAYQCDIIDLCASIRQKEQPSLTLSEELKILDDIALQLDVMHEKHQVIHHDLKPDNILFRRNKDGSVQAKICDFGLCYRPEKGQKPLFAWSYGTLSYTSPEVLENPKKRYTSDERKAQDVYAFGSIAYGLYHGEPVPWFDEIENAVKNNDASATRQVFRKQKEIISTEIAVPKTAEEEYNNLVCSMLHPDPKKRPTAKQIREHIAQIKKKYSV